MSVKTAIRNAERKLPGQPAYDDGPDERWQSIIQIGEFVASEPEAVWSFVERWGAHPDSDLRTAVATCLLEHLLEYDFKELFPRVEAAARKSARFADTFSKCSAFGQSEEPGNAEQFVKLMKYCGKRAT